MGKRRIPKISSNFSNINGTRIHYLTSGKGKPLIVLHGYMTTARTFEGFIKYLSSQYKVYAPDLPGFGLSEELPGNPTLEESIDIIIEWIKKEKIKHFILAGFSLGGHAMLYMAQKTDKLISGHVFIEPYYSFKTLLFSKLTMLKLKIATFFFLKVFPHFLRTSFWKRKGLLLRLERILKLYPEAISKNRPVQQLLEMLSSAKYKTFWQMLSIILQTDLRGEKFISTKPTVMAISKNDDLLDYSQTIQGYRKLFPHMREFALNTTKHYPLEPMTIEYIKEHFPKLLDQIIDYFENYKSV